MAFAHWKQYNVRMKAIFLFACFALFLMLPVALRAQQEPVAPLLTMPDGEVVREPVCFNVINKAPYSVMGSFVTNVYTTDDGGKARHRSNFRLESNYKSEFCTYGPFYEGRKLELVLRTLIPIFSCKTAVTGDILIYGRRKPEGGTDTWAVCL